MVTNKYLFRFQKLNVITNISCKIPVFHLLNKLKDRNLNPAQIKILETVRRKLRKLASTVIDKRTIH
jgi:hypothetical protein